MFLECLENLEIEEFVCLDIWVEVYKFYGICGSVGFFCMGVLVVQLEQYIDFLVVGLCFFNIDFVDEFFNMLMDEME